MGLTVRSECGVICKSLAETWWPFQMFCSHARVPADMNLVLHLWGWGLNVRHWGTWSNLLRWTLLNHCNLLTCVYFAAKMYQNTCVLHGPVWVRCCYGLLKRKYLEQDKGAILQLQVPSLRMILIFGGGGSWEGWTSLDRLGGGLTVAYPRGDCPASRDMLRIIGTKCHFWATTNMTARLFPGAILLHPPSTFLRQVVLFPFYRIADWALGMLSNHPKVT